jgi:hypothetical protein
VIFRIGLAFYHWQSTADGIDYRARSHGFKLVARPRESFLWSYFGGCPTLTASVALVIMRTYRFTKGSLGGRYGPHEHSIGCDVKLLVDIINLARFAEAMHADEAPLEAEIAFPAELYRRFHGDTRGSLAKHGLLVRKVLLLEVQAAWRNCSSCSIGMSFSPVR